MSQTVERAVAILERLSDQPSTLGEVADLLGVHKSTALRLLQTLERAGYARREPDGRYAVGARLIGIAFKALESLDIREIARPHLSKLNQAYGHTVHLASFLDGEITYVDKYEGQSSIRMYSRIGKAVAPHASGVGKAILAHLEPALLDAVIAHTVFTRYTPQTLASEHELRAELARVRERGYARDDREFEEFIHCIAAPIRSGDGAVRTAFSMSVPTVVLSFEELERFVPDLSATADAISRDLGWPG